MPPKCQPPDSYNLPGSSRNTPLQGEQIHDQNIGADQVLNDVDMALEEFWCLKWAPQGK